MIVITGASGHLGRHVFEHFTDRVDPAQLVAGVRTPQRVADLAARGVNVRTLDYARPDTIRAALDGADQVLLISSSEVGQRVAQHRAVIDAAVDAGVAHLVYTSILRADTSPLILANEHRATEAAIRAAGLTATILRNGWYIENYTENLAPALEHGTIVGSAGNGRIAAASRADFAEAAVAVLTNNSLRGRTFELAGTAFTMAELAAAVTDVVGRAITYSDLPASAYQDLLVANGLPPTFAEILVDADLGVSGGHLDAAPTDLEELIGRRSTPLHEAITAALSPAAVTTA